MPGAAFMELQMYPPGYAPAISCDQTHWCAALTIDSLQASYGALHGPGSPPNALANPNCPEPVNFAFLTHSGRPVGPPGPDQQTDATFTPTPDVLLMNPGTGLKVTMHDTPAGYFTKMTDLTTHQSGFMTASVRNGFRHIVWDPVNFTCNGAPYAFHAMYDTARSAPLPNGQPTAWTTWSAHTDNVAYDVETGHFEPPDAATDPSPRRRPAVLHRPARFPGAWARTPTSTATRTTPEIGPTGGRTLPTPELPQHHRRPNGRLRTDLSDRPFRDRPAAHRGGQQRRPAVLRPPHRRGLHQSAAGCVLSVVSPV